MQDISNQINQWVTAHQGFSQAIVQKLKGIKSDFCDRQHAVPVYKQGHFKRYFLNGRLETGGHTKDEALFKDPQYPHCLDPQPPYYINLLEVEAKDNKFGKDGDFFKIEFFMTHRGMGSHKNYTSHLVFTGASAHDSVAGLLEVKKASIYNAIQVHISMEGAEDQQIKIDVANEGETIPVTFADIAKTNRFARITLEVDSRRHVGATRGFYADVMYSSDQARPAEHYVTQTKPIWNQPISS
jgi:hypothetical protein